MYKEVTIGEKKVPMKAVASVDDMYLSVFHEDPVKLQAKDDFDTGDLINFTKKMGFIMAKFAELNDRKKVKDLTEDDYLDWLDQFERSDFMEATIEIKGVYEGQDITFVEAKKKLEELTAQ